MRPRAGAWGRRGAAGGAEKGLETLSGGAWRSFLDGLRDAAEGWNRFLSETWGFGTSSRVRLGGLERLQLAKRTAKSLLFGFWEHRIQHGNELGKDPEMRHQTVHEFLTVAIDNHAS